MNLEKPMLFIVLLLFIIGILAAAVFVLFHHHVVNLHTWHQFLASESSAARAELGNLRTWLAEHAHLHTASPAATPTPSAAPKS